MRSSSRESRGLAMAAVVLLLLSCSAFAGTAGTAGEQNRVVDRRDTPIATLQSLVNALYVLDWDAAVATLAPRSRERLVAELEAAGTDEEAYRDELLEKLTFAGGRLTDEFYQWQIGGDIEGRVTVPIGLTLIGREPLAATSLEIAALRRGNEYLLDTEGPKRLLDLLATYMSAELRPRFTLSPE